MSQTLRNTETGKTIVRGDNAAERILGLDGSNWVAIDDDAPAPAPDGGAADEPMSVSDTLKAVGEDQQSAETELAAELARSKPRKSLVSKLTAIANAS